VRGNWGKCVDARRHAAWIAAALLISGVATVAGVDVSAATPATISSPGGITEGPDGALWFTNGVNAIGRITTAGVVTTFTDAKISSAGSITAGPDGALWFTNGGINSIGRITTAGVVTSFTDASLEGLSQITAGPDGALWFTMSNRFGIGRITTASVVSNYNDPGIVNPTGITAGPDGALWFANGGSIGRITTAGVVTLYADLAGNGQPGGITAGPDGALWFTDSPNNGISIGRITTAGVVSHHTLAIDFTTPGGITTGPDGALWFTSDGIGRITTAGVVTRYTNNSIVGGDEITVGPDGALWFTDHNDNSIVRITTAGVMTIYPDVSPPVVAMSAPASLVRLSTSVAVGWSGHDGSGVAHFDVRQRPTTWNSAPGAWTSWMPATHATSANYSGSPGHTYCFGARAHDSLGNVSGWAASKCAAVPLRSDQLTYTSSFKKTSSTASYAGVEYTTATHGAVMSRTGIVAKRVSVVLAKCRTCGSVQIRWNGALVATLNTYWSVTYHQQVVTVASWPTAHSGTLTATVTSATGKTIAIEGLAVYNT